MAKVRHANRPHKTSAMGSECRASGGKFAMLGAKNPKSVLLSLTDNGWQLAQPRPSHPEPLQPARSQRPEGTSQSQTSNT
jgi:hypothetical protein